MTKQQTGAEILAEVKANNKKENNMKNIFNSINWHSVWVVTKTLIILAVIAVSFYGGMKYQEHYYNSVKSEAKSLSAAVSKE